jgi:xylulokinase
LARPWLLAVDLGIGGPDAAAVALDGELLGHAHRPATTRTSPDGGAVQDPAEWWAGLADGVRAILADGAAAPGDILGVGITGHWGATVPVDADGNPAGDCRLRADDRGGRYSSRALAGRLPGLSPGTLMRWIQVAGGAPSPAGDDPLGHELHLRHREPDVYARTRTLMEPLDYLGLRFTGRTAATPASMFLSWLTDNRPGAALAYAPQLVRRSGRDPARLPPLIPNGGVLGEVLPRVAGELGLPAGVPVVAGVPGLHAGVVGSGATAPFAGHLAIGDAAWIACRGPFKRADVVHQVASVPGPGPAGYLAAGHNQTAGACLGWLRDSVVGAPYDELTALAATAPPGSGGVIFTPWLRGERSPVEDRALRAAFLNVSIDTDRARLVRSVLEGVAYNARWLLDAVERVTRRPFPMLRVVGGGATSELWCRIHADVLGRRIERVADPGHANLRGAALFAAIALGRISLADVPRLVPVGAVYEPEPGSRAVHEPAYREFARVYGRLRGLHHRLNA